MEDHFPDNFQHHFPNLYKLGIKPCSLLADSDDDALTPVREQLVTNAAILELFQFMNSNSTCTFSSMRKWLALMFGGVQDDFPTVNSVRQSVLRLSAKLSKMKKMPSSENKEIVLSTFLNEPYRLPSLFVKQEPLASARQRSSSTSSCSSCADYEDVKRANMKLCQEVSDLKIKSDLLSDTDKKLKDTRKKLYSLHRNTKKKLDRRDREVELVKELQQTVRVGERQITKLKADVDRLRHRAAYWQGKAVVVNDDADSVDAASSEHAKLKEEISQLEEENLDLHEKVEEILSESAEQLVTFEKGKYTDDVRACCYELLSLNVGVRNVKPVITAVLNKIAHKQVNRLPGRSVLCDMMVECLTIAQAQLGEELSQEIADNCTLQSDGTSKYGTHFSTYDITTTEETYTLGLRHVFSGSAQNTMDTLLEILEDLDVVRNKLSQSEVSSKIIAKIKNTMSDRHAANKLFFQILSDYREDILPDVVAGWQDMSSKEHDQIIRMNNFFCGLHFLVALADAAEATLKLWESSFEDNSSDKQSSSTQRLIRTACKAFHARGSEQAGCSTLFRTFLRHNGIDRLPLAAFRGNRFNIIFYDAAGVYFLKSFMVEYLSQHHGTSLNRLLQAVLTDLQSDTNIAGCKALGIIDKIVTGPFWRQLKTSTVSILDMSEAYTEMKEKFDDWGDDSHSVLENEATLFPEFTNADDPVAHCLFQSSDYDSMVQELLQLLFKSFSRTMQRMLMDHLPGGEFHNVTDPKLISETKSVPTTNVSSERDFAILDRLMSQKPNATYIALEAVLLYSHNKTASWLDSKPPEERERLIEAARSMTSHHRKVFRKRREDIESKRLNTIEEREREMKKKKAKELKTKEDLTLQIQKFGLWTSYEDMEHGLSQISSKKEKVDALKLQINFRRKVLGQVHADKSIFQFSHNRKPLSTEELSQNLSLLFSSGIASNGLSLEQLKRDPELLIYRRIEHLFDCGNGKETWFKGTVLSYEKEEKHYSVVYDNEDDVYTFPLLEDMENGELRIVS